MFACYWAESKQPVIIKGSFNNSKWLCWAKDKRCNVTCPSLPKDARSLTAASSSAPSCSSWAVGLCLTSWAWTWLCRSPGTWGPASGARRWASQLGGKGTLGACVQQISTSAPRESPKVHLLGPLGDFFLPSLAHRCLGIPTPSLWGCGVYPWAGRGAGSLRGTQCHPPHLGEAKMAQSPGRMHSLWLQSQAPSRAFSSWL